jgi:hypothetical protein
MWEHAWNIVGENGPLWTSVSGFAPGSGAVGTGRIANASLSGTFVRTALGLPAFTGVVMELDDAGARQSASQRLPAYVVRAAPDGLGLEWYEFAPPAIATLLARAVAGRPRSAGVRTLTLPRIPIPSGFDRASNGSSASGS